MPLDKKFPGHLLVSNPTNPRDNLYNSVILLLNHTKDTAVGLQINNPLESMNLEDISASSNIDYPNTSDTVFLGGNNAVNKIHIIHSLDWFGRSTMSLNDELAITSDTSILLALSEGRGPSQFRACAGHWHWYNGMLDRMLNDKDKSVSHRWLVAPSTSDIIFTGQGDDQWTAALELAAHHQVSNWF
jgi:putative transcriptional regulator